VFINSVMLDVGSMIVIVRFIVNGVKPYCVVAYSWILEVELVSVLTFKWLVRSV